MLRIEIKLGNIVRQPDCDAIVNAAGEWQRDASVPIHDVAGKEFEEYSSILASLAVSEAKITPALNLPNAWVIYARGPDYMLYEDDPLEALHDCITNILNVAAKNGIRRLAIPTISVGRYKFPIKIAARVIIDAITSFNRDTSVQLVRIVVSTLAHEKFFHIAVES